VSPVKKPWFYLGDKSPDYLSLFEGGGRLELQDRQD